MIGLALAAAVAIPTSYDYNTELRHALGRRVALCVLGTARAGVELDLADAVTADRAVSVCLHYPDSYGQLIGMPAKPVMERDVRDFVKRCIAAERRRRS